MSDEFDDLPDPALAQREPHAAVPAPAESRLDVPRLVSRLYAAAHQSLRGKLMACLVRPLSPLGLAAVAAGAFTVFMRRSSSGFTIAVDDAALFSNAQIAELARFVQQVSPDALQRFASLVANNPVGLAAFSASAALLLLRVLSDDTAAAHGKAAPEARTPGAALP